MLDNVHFYHRIIRKLVVSFGSIFDDMRLVRYDNNSVEIERLTVPLSYASKEKFYKRITSDPDLLNPVQLVLPRMAFEMRGINYDPLRKLTNFNNTFAEGLPLGLKKVKMTPYNFDFNLYIIIRNTEDGAQIVEQILPYFTPDYTVNIDYVGIEEMCMDTPIVFNSITYDDSHEGDPESTRSLMWTLNFTVKGYLFGPINNIKMITKATANVYDNSFETNPLQTMALSGGDGNFKTNELVYQGVSVGEATVTGYVKNWSNTTNNITLYDTNGVFTANTLLLGAVSGAKWNINTFTIDTNQLSSVMVTPQPTTANSEAEAFGFSVDITEYI